MNVDIIPRQFDTEYKGDCCVFVPKLLWKDMFSVEKNETVCVLSNKLKTIYKAVKVIKIDDIIIEEKEESKDDEKDSAAEEKDKIKKETAEAKAKGKKALGQFVAQQLEKL